jgi:hypothetical protein
MSRETYGWWRGWIAEKECERGGNKRRKEKIRKKKRREDKRKENRKYWEETKGEVQGKKMNPTKEERNVSSI